MLTLPDLSIQQAIPLLPFTGLSQVKFVEHNGGLSMREYDVAGDWRNDLMATDIHLYPIPLIRNNREAVRGPNLR